MSTEAKLRKAAKLAKQGKRAAAAALYKEVLAAFPANATARKGLAAISAPGSTAAPLQGGALGASLVPGAAPMARAPASLAGRTAAPKPRAPSGNARRAPANAGPAPADRDMQRLQELMQRGDVRSVIAEGTRLSLLFPRAPALQNLLASAHARVGEFDEAIAGYDRVIAIDPDFAGAYANKASALARNGRYEEAEEAARAALARDRSLPQAHMLLGYALVNTGHPKEALKPFETAVQLAPNLVQAQIGLGNACAVLGRHAKALEAFDAARAIEPDNIDVLNNVGNTLAALDRLDDAIAILTDAVRAHPRHVLLRGNYIRALRDFGDVDTAIDEARAVIGFAPEDSTIWTLLGGCYRERGEWKNSEAALRRAIEIKPDNYDAISLRWQNEDLPLAHPDYARIEAASRDPDFTDRQRAGFEFVLFRANDAADRIDDAFAHLYRANTLRRRAEPYDIKRQSRVFAALRKQFADPVEALDAAAIDAIPASRRPVLIVGMPRSGTTLVEQILASHSQVHGAGELNALTTAESQLGWRHGQIGEPPTRENLMRLRRDYLGALGKIPTDRPVVTDKTPLNFRFLGHALAAIPEARVLVMKRDARATCWSNYSNSFVGRANNFGNDMVDTAEMYLMHLEMVAFWIERFADRITVVPYERLTEHQEEESRKLVAAAGLDWEPACLAFHKTRRAVRTVSAVQVRQKMYKGSSEAWHRYEAYLGPMLERLAGLD